MHDKHMVARAPQGPATNRWAGPRADQARGSPAYVAHRHSTCPGANTCGTIVVLFMGSRGPCAFRRTHRGCCTLPRMLHFRQTFVPADIDTIYEMRCKNCKDCAGAHPPPRRTHNRGMSAYSVGVLHVIAHAEIHEDGARYHVLHMLDLAPVLLSAYVQSTWETVHTLDKLPTWIDVTKFNANSIVADMAFRTVTLDVCYVHHLIQCIATGASTPWPNRAEAVVR